MSGDGRDDERPREKLSWREVDRRRSGGRTRETERPKSPAEQAREAARAKAYIKQIDGLFSKSKGGAEGERLARAMRDARGTPELAPACRAYRDAVGLPDDVAQLGLFLDSGDSELVLAAITALDAARSAGTLSPTSGLRTQLRLLAQGSDDAVAEAAEDLLAALA
jgi:hypothetical protein